MPDAPRHLDILLVEDNPADVFLTEAAFEEAGFLATLHVARDGEEAVNFVLQDGPFAGAAVPDLILLDLNLPRKNGFEVLRELKSNERSRHIPVVILSTSDAQEDVRRTYELHANSYTTKPAGLPEFIEFVQGLERYWVKIARLPSKSA